MLLNLRNFTYPFLAVVGNGICFCDELPDIVVAVNSFYTRSFLPSNDVLGRLNVLP